MHVKVKVIYNYPQDEKYYSRLKEGLPLLNKVMERSAKPFEMNKSTIKADNGVVSGAIVEFVVDEFYEKIVTDFIQSARINDPERWDWFKMKYKVA